MILYIYGSQCMLQAACRRQNAHCSLTLITRICMPARRAGTTSIKQAIHIVQCRQYRQNILAGKKCSACSRRTNVNRGLGGKKL
jgi:hypothetical protein